jgi:CubicO group peptidase (beta-lactamase class C family)
MGGNSLNVTINKQIKCMVLTMIAFIFFLGTFLFMEDKSALANSNNKIEEIDHFIQNKLEENHIPGAAVAITHNQKVFFTKGYGMTAKNSPITADTPFAIASLSKAFTALAVMQLVEERKINLDQPVVQYIPSLKLNGEWGANITVRH